MRKALKLFLCAFMITGFMQNIVVAHAQDNLVIKNDSTGIPDKNLYDKALKIGDLNKDGVLTIEESQLITDLGVYSDGNLDLKGIEFMTNLSSLDLQTSYGSFSKILNIDKLLSLTQLKNFTVDNFKQLDLETISQIATLTYLALQNSDITDISSLSKLNQLTELRLGRNQISDISALANLTQLIHLDVSYNSLETLPNLKALTNLDFVETYKGSSADNEVYYITTFSDNRLSKDELINKLPDSVKNHTKWLEANMGKPREESIGISNSKDFSTEKIVSLLNDKWVKGIEVNSYYHLQTIPQEIIDAIKKAGKYLFIFNDDFNISWLLAADNVQSIQGDLSLDYEMKSQYEDIIKKSTGINKLMFITFKANESIGITNVRRYDDTGLPIEINIGGESFYQEESGEWNAYVYSYNPVTGKIRKQGYYFSKDKGSLYIKLQLEKNANTIFISNQDGLDKSDIVSNSVSNEVTKPSIPQINTPNKVIDSKNGLSVKEIKNALEDNNVNQLTVNLSQSDTLSNDLLNSIQSSQKEVTFNVLDKDNKVKYSWSFNGKDMKVNDKTTLDLSIDFQTDKQKEITKLTNQTNIFYLQFAYHGKLPAPSTIRVNVSSQYKDGETVYLYYFDEEANTIRKSSNAIKVENGYAKFEIDHCSTYLLAKQEIKNTPNAVKTSDNTNIVLTLSCAFLALVGICLLIKKRKH